MVESELTQHMLNSMNVEQAKGENRENLDKYGGVEGLAKMIKLDLSRGLTNEQVIAQRQLFGNNSFPETPMDSYLSLLIGALGDSTLLILLAAATVSVIIGAIQEPHEGWIDGVAIYIAVFLVSNISAGNDYSKQLQFAELEKSSAKDERTSVLRDGVIERINPIDLVVGDVIVLQVCIWFECFFCRYRSNHLCPSRRYWDVLIASMKSLTPLQFINLVFRYAMLAVTDFIADAFVAAVFDCWDTCCDIYFLL